MTELLIPRVNSELLFVLVCDFFSIGPIRTLSGIQVNMVALTSSGYLHPESGSLTSRSIVGKSLIRIPSVHIWIPDTCVALYSR